MAEGLVLGLAIMQSAGVIIGSVCGLLAFARKLKNEDGTFTRWGLWNLRLLVLGLALALGATAFRVFKEQQDITSARTRAIEAARQTETMLAEIKKSAQAATKAVTDIKQVAEQASALAADLSAVATRVAEVSKASDSAAERLKMINSTTESISTRVSDTAQKVVRVEEQLTITGKQVAATAMQVSATAMKVTDIDGQVGSVDSRSQQALTRITMVAGEVTKLEDRVKQVGTDVADRLLLAITQLPLRVLQHSTVSMPGRLHGVRVTVGDVSTDTPFDVKFSGPTGALTVTCSPRRRAPDGRCVVDPRNPIPAVILEFQKHTYRVEIIPDAHGGSSDYLVIGVTESR
jgi:archaellum component FlaC